MKYQPIKVKVTDLIKKVEEYIERNQVEYDRRVKEYPTELKQWHKEVMANLDESVKRAKSIPPDADEFKYGGISVSGKSNRSRPDNPETAYGNSIGFGSKASIDHAKRDLEVLRMSSSDTISVSIESNWSRYL